MKNFVRNLHARPSELFDVDPNQTSVIKAQRLQILKRQPCERQGVALALKLGVLESDGFKPPNSSALEIATITGVMNDPHSVGVEVVHLKL
jgi:hypothetical protein